MDDDGSSDGTAEVARAADASVISHEKNRGTGADSGEAPAQDTGSRDRHLARLAEALSTTR